MKTENQPAKLTIRADETIDLQTRFGGCSRGKCWGKYYANQTRATGEWVWVEKNTSTGTLYLSGPGFYAIGSNDGFHRKAQTDFVLTVAKLPLSETYTEDFRAE